MTYDEFCMGEKLTGGIYTKPAKELQKNIVENFLIQNPSLESSSEITVRDHI
jgi:hypothetical protein